jgi:hypothetical protein
VKSYSEEEEEMHSSTTKTFGVYCAVQDTVPDTSVNEIPRYHCVNSHIKEPLLQHNSLTHSKMVNNVDWLQCVHYLLHNVSRAANNPMFVWFADQHKSFFTSHMVELISLAAVGTKPGTL